MTNPESRRLFNVPPEYRWVAAIVGLLLMNVCICAVTVVAALRHPVQIEPDYYERSLNWQTPPTRAEAPPVDPRPGPGTPTQNEADP